MVVVTEVLAAQGGGTASFIGRRNVLAQGNHGLPPERSQNEKGRHGGPEKSLFLFYRVAGNVRPEERGEFSF
jgi:hypothetical protein